MQDSAHCKEEKYENDSLHETAAQEKNDENRDSCQSKALKVLPSSDYIGYKKTEKKIPSPGN